MYGIVIPYRYRIRFKNTNYMVQEYKRFIKHMYRVWTKFSEAIKNIIYI